MVASSRRSSAWTSAALGAVVPAVAIVAATVLTAVPAAAQGARGADSGTHACSYFGTSIDCSNGFGTWSEHLQCWVKQMSTQPPADDPLWDGHLGGAIHRCQTPTVPGSLFADSFAFWAPGPEAEDAVEPVPVRSPFAAMALQDPVAALQAGRNAVMEAGGHLGSHPCRPPQVPKVL